MSSTSDTSRWLRNALRANGAFSATTGTAALAFARPLAESLGITDPTLLPGLGLNLIVFAVLLFLLASRPVIRRGLALTVVGLDAAWVVGSIAVLFAGVLTVTGNWTVAIIADVVAAFGILQYMGVRRLPAPIEETRTA